MKRVIALLFVLILSVSTAYAAEGDIVTFGSYADEAIEWLVLEETDDHCVMISVKGLEAVPFMEQMNSGEVNWENSYARAWLNGTFFDTAFTEEEKQQILNGVTGDPVYLLSTEEAESYFPDQEARICSATENAVNNGVWDGNRGICGWWLRTPGLDDMSAAYVNLGGIVFASGERNVDTRSMAVRPVVCVAR